VESFLAELGLLILSAVRPAVMLSMNGVSPASDRLLSASRRTGSCLNPEPVSERTTLDLLIRPSTSLASRMGRGPDLIKDSRLPAPCRAGVLKPGVRALSPELAASIPDAALRSGSPERLGVCSTRSAGASAGWDASASPPLFRAAAVGHDLVLVSSDERDLRAMTAISRPPRRRE